MFHYLILFALICNSLAQTTRRHPESITTPKYPLQFNLPSYSANKPLVDRNVPATYNSQQRTDTGYERVYEKVNTILDIERDQLRKLDTLDRKITAFDQTHSRRLEEILNDRKSLARLDEQTTTTGPVVNKPTNYGSDIGNVSTTVKLDALATLLASTRIGLSNVETTIEQLAVNISNLLQISKELIQRQHELVTKQYLHNALASIRGYSFQNPIAQTFGPLDMGDIQLPNSCLQVSEFGLKKTGVQKIQLKTAGHIKEPFYVWCDMELEGGGWTVIQNRKDGVINFQRNWLEYKNGFGNIAGEFFIGLDKLHALTSNELNELMIVLEDFNQTVRTARYNMFAISGEDEHYRLNLLGQYEGNAGDALAYSAAHKFSTFDNDNDGWVEGNCAQAHSGAWWYNACEMSNLNGKYLKGNTTLGNIFQGVYWNDFHGPSYSLKSTKMLIRPVP